ncbi:hypothetical protein [Pandoraea sputorum]|uniref:hypothetical protein n=1 Tax=Pandoraea sputorum TaxID=93222 RepID=UPI002AF6CB6B|nr:hypothetical protein [Pandoraea sputorum]
MKSPVSKQADAFADVAAALSVAADNPIKILISVEGPLDIQALRAFARCRPDIARLLAGSSIRLHFFSGFGRRETHIYDSDIADYARLDGL